MTGMKKLKRECAERKAQRQRRLEAETEARTKASVERRRERDRLQARRDCAALPGPRRRGNHPGPEGGWRKLKHVKGWNVWWRSLGDGWVSLKVVRCGYASGKANYWLGYAPGEKRWAQNADGKALGQRPELQARVRGLVESTTWRVE